MSIDGLQLNKVADSGVLMPKGSDLVTSKIKFHANS